MTHFWITGGPTESIDSSIWAYYVDGEEDASVQFIPALACGSGFLDQEAPWSNKWFGKGAKTGGWWHNFRIPFQKSIKITGRLNPAVPGPSQTGYYVIVRGSENLPISIGDIQLPSNAKMQLQRVEGQELQPLDFVDIVSVETGYSGLLFLHTLQVDSGNWNFLEGCYHAYYSSDQQFPAHIVSTGTEDYYDSAFYFDGGQFHGENSGFTHINATSTDVAWSAYRMHDSDPLIFRNGFRFQWRNGDVTDPATGLKCTAVEGSKDGDPQPSNITSYAWVYTWPNGL